MKFCNRPFDSMYILPSGECRVCGWTTPISVLGNLAEEELEDIWNSESARKIREAIKEGNFEYCMKTSCPFLENDSLPEITEADMEKMTARPLPTRFNVACDFICNHSCPSCRSEVFVPDEEYKRKVNVILGKLLPYLNRKDTESVSTDGCGDCFASPYIMNMLENLQPENDSCEIHLETNGALFDEKHWERICQLAKYKLDVVITPNSFVKTTFEYLNGGHNTYDAVIHNLGFIRDLKHAGSVSHMSISIVVQERNFWELPSFAKRCIEEFDADEVIVKPIYHWFRMKEDDYWFKDVLNPLHPYHKEYLRMLEAPELKHPKVYFWGSHNLHESRRHPAYLYKEHMEITGRLLGNSAAAQLLEGHLEKMGIRSLYIYGDVDLANVFYHVLGGQTNIRIKGFMAKEVTSAERCGQKILCFCDYEPDDTDAILVLNYNYMEKIVRDFHFIGYKGKLLTAQELMECIPMQSCVECGCK